MSDRAHSDTDYSPLWGTMAPEVIMRAWTVRSFGPHPLELTTIDRPTPGPGQALLRVRAVSLNYRDQMMVRGRYNPRQPLPLVPCSDAVGDVISVGEEVSHDLVGTRVCPAFSQSWLGGPPNDAMLRSTLGGPLPGTLQEYVVVQASSLVPAPSHLSDAQCATLPCSAVTAWRALMTEGRLRAGDSVLTLGTGGVSLFALQLANALGARVVITSSSDDKLRRAAELGAAHGINYRSNPTWGKLAAQWSCGGVDHVVELGGAGTLTQSLRAVKTGGTISLIGVLSGVDAQVPLTRILMRHLRVQGIFVGSRDDFVALVEFLAEHPEVQPVVDRVFSFDEAPQAFDYLAEQRHMGKIVVKVT